MRNLNQSYVWKKVEAEFTSEAHWQARRFYQLKEKM